MLPRLMIVSSSRSVSKVVCSFLPVTLAAPAPAPFGFRPLHSGLAPGISSRPSAAPQVIEIQGSISSFHVPPFIDWSGRLLWLLLTSAEHEETVFQFPCSGISPSAGRQTSPGNARDLHPIYPPHLQPHPLDGYRALKSRAFSPGYDCLLCDFCSSDRDFACGFLQIPPRDGHPCRPANGSHHQGP